MGRSEELGTGVSNVYKYSKAYSGSDHILFEENDVFIAKVPLSDGIYGHEEPTTSHDIQSGIGLNEGLNEGLTTLLKPLLKIQALKPKSFLPF